MEPNDDLIRRVMSDMGRKGGAVKKTKKPKGLAAVSPERRAEIAALGVSAKKRRKQAIDNLKRLK